MQAPPHLPEPAPAPPPPPTYAPPPSHFEEAVEPHGARPHQAAQGQAGLLARWFGIGLGRIDLSLRAHHFEYGETVSGALTLSLKEPTEAKGLVVGVRATQKVVSREKDAQGHLVTKERPETLFQQDCQLGGPRTYAEESHDFGIVIPRDLFAHAPQLPEGTLGDIARVVSYFMPDRRLPIEWEVYATLLVPQIWKKNVAARQGISVSPP